MGEVSSRFVRLLPIACILLALLAPLAAGETGIAVIVTHPYPDDADPLGFPFRAGFDAHMIRHGHRSDTLAYPHIVLDGTHVFNGLPDPSRPQDALDENLTRALADRHAADPPVEIQLTGRIDGDEVTVQIDVSGVPQLPNATLWLALTEDNVAFRPPAAVSNGVFNHRFTTRAMVEVATFSLERGIAREQVIPIPEGAKRDALSVVVWVQADASGERFGPHEVLQAATLHVSETLSSSRQTARAVLVEMRSATWCDPCLFGDRAVEQLAEEHGLIQDAERLQTTYWRAPEQPLLPLLAALAGAALIVWFGRRT